jgi:cytochrome P450
VLRFDTSILMWRRVATRDTAIGDVDIPKDARVVLAFGAAARQADRFPDPDNFDIRRSDARRHLAFGKGIHLCAGANLARLEADIALNALMDRLPSPKLAKQELQYYPNVTIRGPRALYIEW